MSKYYLLSGMDKNNNYDFYKNVEDILKKDLNGFESIIYISGYPNDTKQSLNLIKSDKFSKIGINFLKVISLDSSYSKADIKNIVNKNNLIFLYGGNPVEQMKFIKNNELEEILKYNNKTLITLSAGTINMCKTAICSKDEDFKKTTIYNGIGMLEYSIESHFDINNIVTLNELKALSKSVKIYALEDDAFIINENGKDTFYGNIYEIANGKINKIN